MRGPARRQTWLIGIGITVVALMLVPMFYSGQALLRLELVILYVAAATGLNYALGYAGLFALSQVAVIGIGAYTAGLLSAHQGWPFWATVPAALVVGCVLNVLVGLPALRVPKLYLGIITFFAVVALKDIVDLFGDLTGGDNGLIGIASPAIRGELLGEAVVYEIVLAVGLLSLLGLRNLIHSGWGIRVLAYRDAPLASQAVGLAATKTLPVVLFLSAVPAALAGALFAHTEQFVSMHSFGLTLTLLLLAGVELGGRGTLFGPVLGTGLLMFFSLTVGEFSSLNTLLLGAVLLGSVLLFPRGLLPTVVTAVRNFFDRRRPQHQLAEGDGAETVVDSASADLPQDLRRDVGGSSGLPLRTAGLIKRFGGHLVLRGTDLHVGHGELVGLVGANGSGKTTLINVVTGLLAADGGELWIDGRPRGRKAGHTVPRLGVSRSFQIPQLIDELSVQQNIELGLLHGHKQSVFSTLFRIAGFRHLESRRQQVARDVCMWLGFDAAASQRPAGELSLGLKRVVEVGRAVATGAPLVCLDEPAAGLNAAERTRLATLLRQLRAANRSVLLVEHHLEFVMSLCDRVLLMDAGKIVAAADLHASDETARSELPAELESYLNLVPNRRENSA